MSGIARFDRLLSVAERYAFQICAISVFIIMVVGATDIVLGNTINVRLTATIDISQAFFAICVFLALPIVIRKDGHIRMDLLFPLYSGRIKGALDRISDGLSVIAYLALAYGMWDLFADSWDIKEKSVSLFAFPIYPIKFVAFVGLTMATLVSLCRLVWWKAAINTKEALGE